VNVQVEQETDWDFALENQDIAHTAALSVAQQYGNTIEYDDAFQEALLVLATSAQAAADALRKGAGVLHRMLYQDVTDKIRAEAKHRAGQISHEALTTKGLELEAADAV
jgi:hypothetical protein